MALDDEVAMEITISSSLVSLSLDTSYRNCGEIAELLAEQASSNQPAAKLRKLVLRFGIQFVNAEIVDEMTEKLERMLRVNKSLEQLILTFRNWWMIGDTQQE
ncbi:hypothetical protein PybrP1_003796 [[Pythium] brassicae (nom. inval.)]|nr:hypothetical protein PybrP1_003796 [[Pythium] brassicae (nom. inval.)]